MIAVFYDRKHGCEVRSDELMSINLGTNLISKDPYEPEEPSGYHWHQMGEIGYKSRKCKKDRNWDRALMVHDLVFLRLEDTDEH